MTTKNIQILQNLLPACPISEQYWLEDFGISPFLSVIFEHIIGELPSEDVKQFFSDFSLAIGYDGRNLSLVHWKFLEDLLRHLPIQNEKIQTVIDGIGLFARGDVWNPEQAKIAAVTAYEDFHRQGAADGPRAAAFAALSASVDTEYYSVFFACRFAADAARTAAYRRKYKEYCNIDLSHETVLRDEIYKKKKETHITIHEEWLAKSDEIIRNYKKSPEKKGGLICAKINAERRAAYATADAEAKTALAAVNAEIQRKKSIAYRNIDECANAARIAEIYRQRDMLLELIRQER